MTRKNYLKDMQPDNKKMRAGSIGEYLAALKDFLRKPKTRFDLVDRGRFLILLVLLIILLQKVVENFSN